MIEGIRPKTCCFPICAITYILSFSNLLHGETTTEFRTRRSRSRSLRSPARPSGLPAAFRRPMNSNSLRLDLRFLLLTLNHTVRCQSPSRRQDGARMLRLTRGSSPARFVSLSRVALLGNDRRSQRPAVRLPGSRSLVAPSLIVWPHVLGLSRPCLAWAVSLVIRPKSTGAARFLQSCPALTKVPNVPASFLSKHSSRGGGIQTSRALPQRSLQAVSCLIDRRTSIQLCFFHWLAEDLRKWACERMLLRGTARRDQSSTDRTIIIEHIRLKPSRDSLVL